MNRLLQYQARYLLVGAAVLLLAASYQLAFRHTFAALQLRHNLREELAGAGDLSIQPAYLDRKFKNLDELTARYRADTSIFRAAVINAVTLIADEQHARVTEVPGIDTAFNRKGLIVQKISLKGDFFFLLKIYDQLNSTVAIGLVRSVTIKEPQHRNAPQDRQLTMDIYLSAIR